MTTRRRPLGCMTATAFLFAVSTLLVLVGAAVVTGNGIFSPGPLNARPGAVVGGVTSHAALSGDCGACHTAIWSGQTMADRCLACHTAVGDELAAGSGLHGRFETSGQCLDCHTDHHGAAASLTVANLPDFPHELTGYSLRAHTVGTGPAHGAVGCADCHTRSLGSFDAATCATCHRQIDPGYMTAHVDTFGTECLACHDGVDAYGHDFNHAGWPLQGGHAERPCSACHQGARDLPTLRATSTACAACHATDDIHEGRLGGDCAACHDTSSWTEPTDGFDHATTGFALQGAHATPACEACHAGGRYAATPTDCIGCHEADDAHEGNLGTDCEACHSVSTWKEAAFDHDEARFPLTGTHRTALCSACHTRLTLYRGTPTTCVACHRAEDAHRGALGTDCSACHGTKTWAGARFDHATTGYALTGAHASAGCTACHAGDRYKGTPKACVACHARDDAHAGEFGRACGACHSTRRWSGARVDHSRTEFPLTGAHRGVSCVKCHRNNTFQGTPTACSACHSKPSSHQPSAFSACVTCHSTRAWRPAAFNRPHSFPTGHRNADGICARCHPATWGSYSCASCHSNRRMDEEHKDEPGYSRTTCVRCHPDGDKD